MSEKHHHLRVGEENIWLSEWVVTDYNARTMGENSQTHTHNWWNISSTRVTKLLLWLWHYNLSGIAILFILNKHKLHMVKLVDYYPILRCEWWFFGPHCGMRGSSREMVGTLEMEWRGGLLSGIVMLWLGCTVEQQHTKLAHRQHKKHKEPPSDFAIQMGWERRPSVYRTRLKYQNPDRSIKIPTILMLTNSLNV